MRSAGIRSDKAYTGKKKGRGACCSPKLETAEYNTKAPTLHGYYLDLLWSGVIAALCGFALSFLMDQVLVYYVAIGIMALVLVVRTVVFMARQAVAENR